MGIFSQAVSSDDDAWVLVPVSILIAVDLAA